MFKGLLSYLYVSVLYEHHVFDVMMVGILSLHLYELEAVLPGNWFSNFDP